MGRLIALVACNGWLLAPVYVGSILVVQYQRIRRQIDSGRDSSLDSVSIVSSVFSQVLLYSRRLDVGIRNSFPRFWLPGGVNQVNPMYVCEFVVCCQEIRMRRGLKGRGRSAELHGVSLRWRGCDLCWFIFVVRILGCVALIIVLESCTWLLTFGRNQLHGFQHAVVGNGYVLPWCSLGTLDIAHCFGENQLVHVLTCQCVGKAVCTKIFFLLCHN